MSHRDEVYSVGNIVNNNVISLYDDEGGQKVQPSAIIRWLSSRDVMNNMTNISNTAVCYIHESC